MNDTQIACFLAVADHLSFTKAALQLHMTHPAVSQQIQSLEKELGTRLFDRTTRSVALTDDGRLFWNDARQIQSLMTRARLRYLDTQREDVEQLVVGCFDYVLLTTVLPGILSRLAVGRPGVHPRTRMVPFTHIYQLLSEGDLDVVIGFQESSSLKISAAYREIMRVPLVCVCRGDHPFAHKKAVTDVEIKNERMILYAPDSDAPRSIIRSQEKLIGDRPFVDFNYDESAEGICSLVSAGYGISVLPKVLIPAIPALAAIPLADEKALSFGVYCQSTEGNPAVRAFVRCAVQTNAADT